MRYKYLNQQEFGAQTRLLRQVDDAILAPSNAMISAHLGLVLQEDIGCTLGVYFFHTKLDQIDPRFARKFGTDHKDTLAVMAHIALTYRDQGQDRWTQVEDLFVHAIKTSRRVLSEQPSFTLVMMNNLAGMYWRQKRWKEVEELYSQELEARKKVFGREHCDT